MKPGQFLFSHWEENDGTITVTVEWFNVKNESFYVEVNDQVFPKKVDFAAPSCAKYSKVFWIDLTLAQQKEVEAAWSASCAYFRTVIN